MRSFLLIAVLSLLAPTGSALAASQEIEKKLEKTTPTVPRAIAIKAASKAPARLKLDNFEDSMASQEGGMWWSGCDANKMGTTLAPAPFATSEGGAPKSPGHAGRIHGHLGANSAPWAWAALSLTLKHNDLSAYKTLELWVKGDGQAYTVRLQKKGLVEAENYAAIFVAPKEWTKLKISFESFKQPDWATKKVEPEFDDVEKLAFYPMSFDGDYDLSVDELSVVR
ncbi:MAG: CIA30 family protein [candidate division FCPU426 bacterium]